MRLPVVVVLCILATVIYIYLEYQDRQRLRRRLVVLARRRLQALCRRRRRARAQAARATEPEVLTHLRSARTSFLFEDRWISLLEIGDVYRKGSYPTHLPDTDLALRLYKAACACPDGSVSGAAQTRFIECRVEPISSIDRSGVPLPRVFADECLAHAASLTSTFTATTYQRPRVVSLPPPRQPPPRQPPVPTVPVAPVAPVAPVILSDTQNVHDHGVTHTLRQSLASMPRSQTSYDEIVLGLLESDAPSTVKADAMEVLDSLSSDVHSSLNVSERDALGAVWSAIDRDVDPALREDARRILLGQLASGVESGGVVCSTGKIARMVSSLDGVSETANVTRPMWAIRDEIGSLAARVRDSGEEGTADAFRSSARNEYIDGLGMDARIIAPIIDEFALGFE
jgi:hypothetical protein